MPDDDHKPRIGSSTGNASLQASGMMGHWQIQCIRVAYLLSRGILFSNSSCCWLRHQRTADSNSCMSSDAKPAMLLTLHVITMSSAGLMCCSPHVWTGLTGLALLSFQAMLPLFFADSRDARTVVSQSITAGPCC